MMLARIQHYFLSYKVMPGNESTVRIPLVYSAERARDVVTAAMDDYSDMFGGEISEPFATETTAGVETTGEEIAEAQNETTPND